MSFLGVISGTAAWSHQICPYMGQVRKESGLGMGSVPQTVMSILTPREDTALSEQPTIHLLPPDTVMLDDWLIRYAESGAGDVAPVGGVEPYRWVLERFACTA